MNVSGGLDTSAGSPDRDSDAQSANRIAEVSHELRLPIANLKLLIETLLDGASQDSDTCNRMLTRAQQEVERLQKLVNNLLSAEQMNSPRYELQCKLVSLEDLSAYVMDTTRTAAKAKSITVATDIASGWQIFANPEQLAQVMLNLVENALKFTPEGGQVWIKSGPEPGSFTVSDNGIGIAAHELPKIFQRFYRVDRTHSPGSTGLGLSIVKHIAELHGAKIDVQSEEGQGSTFVLHFPGLDETRLGRDK